MCFFTRPSTLPVLSVGASDLDAGAKRRENVREKDRERRGKGEGEGKGGEREGGREKRH